MAAIGILGGMGPQASAHLQSLLVRDIPKRFAVQSDSDFPEIVMVSVPVPNFVDNKQHLDAAKQILLQRTRLLEQAGCIVNGIACNTAHLLLPDLQDATTVPFVSIPALVNARLMEMGAKRVGLLASPNTLRSRLYDEALDSGIELVRPSVNIAAEIEAMIFRRLAGKERETDRPNLHSITRAFVREQRLDAVILGCTELPLIFGVSDDPRILDTLQILSDGLLKEFIKFRKSDL